MQGVTRWVFLGLWSVALFVALSAAFATLPDVYARIAAPASPTTSAGLSINRSLPWPALGPSIGPEAINSGIGRGMRLVTVNGQPVAATQLELDRQLAGPVGGAVAITAVTPSGEMRSGTFTRDPSHYVRALATVGLSPLLYSVGQSVRSLLVAVHIGCAILLMTRRSRDRLSPWASLMMLIMPVATGETGQWAASLFENPDVAHPIINGIAFGLLIVVLAVFPDGRFSPRWSFPVAIIGFVANLLCAPLPNWLSNIVLETAQLAAVAAIVVRYRSMPPGTGRQQIRWALFGFAGSFLSLLMLLLLQFISTQVDDFGAFAWAMTAAVLASTMYTLLLMLALTVSLMRYRLYGADATISRSVAYGALTLGLIAVFGGAEKVIELLGEHYLGARLGALASALGAGIAAMVIIPLHHRTTHWAERRFRSSLASLREGLPLLVGDLREIASPRELADVTLLRVEQGVRAQHGAVAVRDEVLLARDVDPDAVAAWMSRGLLPNEDPGDLAIDRADPLFPMRVPLHADGVGLIGWLLLGPRPDGSFYGRDERAVLRVVADPIARALAIAIAREDRDKERDALERARQAQHTLLHDKIESVRQFIRSRFGVEVGTAS